MYVQIQWTCKNLEEARTIARALIEQKLVACANFIPSIESYYMWEGELEQENEVKVLLKTCKEHFDKISAYIKQYSSYEVPEIAMIHIEKGNPDYVNWIQVCTQISPGCSLEKNKSTVL